MSRVEDSELPPPPSESERACGVECGASASTDHYRGASQLQVASELNGSGSSDNRRCSFRFCLKTSLPRTKARLILAMDAMDGEK